MGVDPEPPPRPGVWLAKTFVVRSVVIMVMEAAAVTVAGLWAIVGTFSYAMQTGGDLEGLLSVLHDKWRGALVLAGFLFYGTIRQLLDRLNLKGIKFPGGEVTFKEQPLSPGHEQKAKPPGEASEGRQ
jgi:hypothetical protein